MSTVEETIIQTLSQHTTPLSAQELVKKTQITPRILLYSVKELINSGDILKTRSLRDARVCVYFINKKTKEVLK